MILVDLSLSSSRMLKKHHIDIEDTWHCGSRAVGELTLKNDGEHWAGIWQVS